MKKNPITATSDPFWGVNESQFAIVSSIAKESIQSCQMNAPAVSLQRRHSVEMELAKPSPQRTQVEVREDGRQSSVELARILVLKS